MDSQGNIYPVSDLSDDQNDQHDQPEHVTREDVARMDGFLRGLAELDKLKCQKVLNRRHETLSFDSSGGKTYRKKDH